MMKYIVVLLDDINSTLQIVIEKDLNLALENEFISFFNQSIDLVNNMLQSSISKESNFKSIGYINNLIKQFRRASLELFYSSKVFNNNCSS